MKYLFSILVVIIVFSLQSAAEGNFCPKGNGYFVENIGQWNQQVRFRAYSPGMTIWITDTAVVFDYFSIDSSSIQLNKDIDSLPKLVPAIRGQRVSMAWSSQSDAINDHREKCFDAIGKYDTPFSYFKGQNTVSSASAYRELVLHNAFDGIGIRFYFEGNAFRYDFLVEQGASPEQISLSFSGQDSLFIASDGSLKLGTSLGELSFSGLQAFQVGDLRSYCDKARDAFYPINNERLDYCHFRLTGERSVGFEVPSYCSNSSLVIDPVLWASYFGGSSSEMGSYSEPVSIAFDSLGYIYITGPTFSSDFPTSLGSYYILGDTLVGMFITKLNPSGSSLVYSAVVASGAPRPYSIAVDHRNYAYLTGFSTRTNLPVSANALQSTVVVSDTNTAAFLFVLNNTGSNYSYSTYLNGCNDDIGYAVAVRNTTGYIGGKTCSPNFITTNGAYQSQKTNPDPDGFVLGIDVVTGELAFSSFLGGNNSDFIYGLTLDNDGNIYTCGYSYGNYPTTANAPFQRKANTEYPSAVISKLSMHASYLLSSTYFAEECNCIANAIVLDSAGKIWICGRAEQSGQLPFPATKNAYKSTFLGGIDCFAAEFNSTLTALEYSTLFGGSGADAARRMAVDNKNNVYFVGYTQSTDFPSLPVSTTPISSGQNGFVAACNSDTRRFIYFESYGGSNFDLFSDVVAKSDEFFYVVGQTFSGDLNMKPCPLDATLNGLNDAIIAKMTMYPTGDYKSNLLACWDFDSFPFKATGKLNLVYSQNSNSRQPAGRVNCSIENSGGIISGDNLNNIYSTDGFTWALWFNGNSIPTNPGIGRAQTLISVNDATVGEEIALGFGFPYGCAPQNCLSFICDNEDANNGKTKQAASWAPNGGFVNNRWYHAVAVANFKEKNIRLFVDGNEVSRVNGDFSGISRQLNAFIGSTCEFNNGSSTPQTGIFDGRIDQVRFYDRPFNKNDVDSLYKNEAKVLFSNLALNTNRVDFGRLVCESEKTQAIAVFNSGTEPISLNNTYLKYASPEISISMSSTTIMPYSNGVINIKYKPRMNSNFSDVLVIDAGSCKPYFEIPLNGSKDSVYFSVGQVSKDTIDFGMICLGATKDSSFVLKNNSSFPSQFGFSVSSSVFRPQFDTVLVAPMQVNESRRVSIRFNATQTGKFLVQSFVFDECGNSRIIYLKGAVNDLSVQLSREIVICSGDSVSISSIVSGGIQPYRYKWIPDRSVLGSNRAYPTVFPQSTTTYYLTATDGYQCSVIDSVLVRVVQPYLPQINGSTVVCSGNAVTYAADMLEGLQVDNEWKMEGNGDIISISSNSITIRWNSPGTARVILNQTVSGAKCINTNEISVEITEPPTVVIAGETLVCKNKLFSYYPQNSSATSNSWDIVGGSIVQQIGDTVTVEWHSAQSHALTLFSSFSKECSSKSMLEVDIEEAPTVALIGIVAVASNSDETYSANVPGASVSWDVVGGSIAEQIDDHSVRIHWDAVGQGTIIIYTTSSLTGCSTKHDYPVDIQSSAVPVISGAEATCESSSSIYSATSQSGLEYSWKLLQNKGTIAQTSYPNRIQVDWSSNGIDTLEMIQTVISTGKSSIVRKEINIFAPSVLNISKPDTVCSSDAPFALGYANPIGGKYSGKGIINGVFHPENADLGPNAIQYSYMNEHGCYSEGSFVIFMYPKAMAPTISLESIGQLDLLVSSAESGNQWYINGKIIEGETGKEYRPTSTGVYSVRASWGGKCQSEESNRIEYSPSIGPQIAGDDALEFGELICDNSKRDSVAIFNSGSSNLVITECFLSGADMNDFSIVSNPAGKTVEPNKKVYLVIDFAPVTTGSKNATITIRSNARNQSDWTIKLKGSKEASSFAISTDRVEFLRIPEGEVVYKYITIANLGTLPIVWQGSITGTYFSIDDIQPQQTLPGGNSIARIRFEAIRSGDIVFDTISIVENNCSLARKIYLNATVTDKAAHADVVIGDTYGNVGDTVRMPVYFANKKLMELSHASLLRTEIKFHKDILFPVDCSGSIYPNNTKMIKRDFDLSQLQNDTIGYLTFAVPLGPDSVTDVSFYGELDIEGEGLVLNPVSGRFYLKNFCREGGFRFFDPNYRRQFNDPKPNPSSGIVTFDMNLIEEGTTRIKILDMKASEMMTAYEAYTRPGTYSIVCNVDDLPNGVYICLIQTPNHCEMKQLIIVK